MQGNVLLLILSAVGGAAGLVTLVRFLLTLPAVRRKDSSDAYIAYRQFVSSSSDDRDREWKRITSEREKLWLIRKLLIDLVQDLILLLRGKGSSPEELDPFQDRLDEVRSM